MAFKQATIDLSGVSRDFCIGRWLQKSPAAQTEMDKTRLLLQTATLVDFTFVPPREKSSAGAAWDY